MLIDPMSIRMQKQSNQEEIAMQEEYDEINKLKTHHVKEPDTVNKDSLFASENGENIYSNKTGMWYHQFTRYEIIYNTNVLLYIRF